MTDRFIYNAADEAATAALGAALAEALPKGGTVALYGTLGAGKTQLVQAIAEAAGVERRNVVSPTFVIIQEHQGRLPIYHIDAYRLRDEDEFLQLGPDEYFESDGLVLIEWADRVLGCLPGDRVEIRITVTGEQSRQFEITAIGGRHAGLIQALAARLKDR
jgi:tRNA threonylcarbamoyladenosine biosynthesis protein TsaE